MDHIIVISDGDFDVNKQGLDTSSYRSRESARAVLLDANGKVYLMNVTKHGYHKLPGGGIDDGESKKDALSRELLEEVGCKADIIKDLGTILEYRDFERLTQTSYCFLAKQTGEQVEAALEESEKEEGMVEVKANSLEEAIQLLKKDTPNNLEGKFIQKRDLEFLKAALSAE